MISTTAAKAPGSPAGGLPSFASSSSAANTGHIGGATFDASGFVVNMKGATATAGGFPVWLLLSLAVGGVVLWKRR